MRTTLLNARSTASGLSSASTSRAVSMKRLNCSGLSDFGFDLRGIQLFRSVRGCEKSPNIHDSASDDSAEGTPYKATPIITLDIMAAPAADEISPKTEVGIGSNHVSRHNADYAAHHASNRKCDLMLLRPTQGIHWRTING